MNKNHKSISVYFDNKHNLIAIPSVNGWDLDLVYALKFPYNTEDLESFILGALNQCFSKKPVDPFKRKVSVLAEYRGVKTWKSAVKGLGAVDVSWLKDSGYEMMPTKKDPKMKYAFMFLPDKIISLGDDFIPGQLAEAFFKAMAISEENGI